MRILWSFVVLTTALCVSGCGKYGRPVSPEVVSPGAVQALAVKGVVDGVIFDWRSPENNARGKELKDLSGYSVERREVTKRDPAAEPAEFEELIFLEDKSVATLEAEREKLREAGTPAHRAKVDDALKTFQYVDRGVTPGTQYLYRVVPVNSYGEGQVRQFVRVLFRGESSEISFVDGSELGDELEDDPFAEPEDVDE